MSLLHEYTDDAVVGQEPPRHLSVSWCLCLCVCGLAGVSSGVLVVRVVLRGKLDALFIHAFGLNPLDEAEEVLIWHGGGAGTAFWRGTPLIVYPGRLAEHKKLFLIDCENILL